MSARRAELSQLPVAARRAVADHTPRPSTHPRRRRPHVKYKRAQNGFQRCLHAFSRALEEHFQLVPYRDSIGRSRVSGRARRRRAQGVLQALLLLQTRRRSGIVYAGYVTLAREMHCSRSTAYRGVKDLRGAHLLGCQPGGGKTHDEVGALVDAANGYLVPDDLAGPEERRPRQPKAVKPAPANERTPGQVLMQERLEAHRARRGP